MASISMAATTPGWESSIRAMRAMPASIKREATSRSRDLAEPLAREVRAAGAKQGSHAAKVAHTTRSTARAGLPMVTAGGPPFTFGSEYGGQRRRKTYYSTSPLGRRYLVVERHTTMQFQPHRRQKGYWFTPTISAGGPGTEAVLKAWARIVDDVIREF